jgi:hypothetical protein
MEISSRDDFPELLNSLGLKGYAVEVGVYTGKFSWWLLRYWEGKTLYCVDPWRYQEDVMFDNSNIEQSEHNAAYGECLATLRDYEDRVKIWREFSVDAAKKFEDNALDFVYIDARHDYRSVTADLNAWYPKVKVGGVIAGHDYKNSFVRRNLVEVKRAVDNFFIQREKVWTTIDDNLPSWYIFKNPETTVQ